jgi:hypothetical protein
MRMSKGLWILFLLPAFAFSQIVIENFDGAVQQETINWQMVESDLSSLEIRDDSTDMHEGAAALYATASIGAINQWGSYAQLGYTVPTDGEPFDWTVSDTLSLWIKVQYPPNIPENFVFRIHIADRSEPGAAKEEYLYENTTICDNEQGWVELKIPFNERETDGSILPNDEGFVLFPKNWGGGTYNDETLNFDSIIGYSFAVVTTGWSDAGPLPEDAIEVSFDYFTRNGTPNVVKIPDISGYSLRGNTPNPFNPSTVIRYHTAQPGMVRLEIFNLMGQAIGTPVNEILPAGEHQFQFNAAGLSPGLYFYRLNAGGSVEARSMTLIP